MDNSDLFATSAETLMGSGPVGLLGFTPRPNRPELFDEQEAFVNAKDRVSFLIKGNACLAGWERLREVGTGELHRLDSLAGSIFVNSVDTTTGQVAVGKVSRVWHKGRAVLYCVQLSSGASFTGTWAHEVLDGGGQWVTVGSLIAGQVLYGGLAVVAVVPTTVDEFYSPTVEPWHNYLLAGVVHRNSGGTEAGAAKTARFILELQEPPRHDTPFWVISETYDLAVDVCWGEKLWGHGYIPHCEVDWPRVAWLRAAEGKPKKVPLKPWPGRPGKNWVLEFKSYEQGRSNMQARSIGGFWFSEQFPWDLFVEVLRGTREYSFPGGQFAEFTPIDPELCLAIEKVMSRPPKGWRFYRSNTLCNSSNLADGWYDEFFAAVPEEMRATRETGALASYLGAIYQSFDPTIHVADIDHLLAEPGWTHYRGVDWGASEQHAFVCVWGARRRLASDSPAEWVIYDEYWTTEQTRITADHAAEIIARSARWGWPTPPAILTPNEDTAGIAKKVRAALGEDLPEKRRLGANHGETFADPSRPGELAAFCRFGIPTAPAANDVLLGIDTVRALLKRDPWTDRPRLVIHPRCAHLIDETRALRWDTKKTAKPTVLKMKDDAPDAMRYMLHTVERGAADVTPTSADARLLAPRRRSIQIDDLRRKIRGIE